MGRTHYFTHKTHTHMHRSINHYIPPLSPWALEARKRGMEEWATDGGGGGLRVIKIGCGLVPVSPANPPSDKRETSCQSTADFLSFYPFSSAASPPPLLSHTVFYHYLIPRPCSGLSHIQIMTLFSNIWSVSLLSSK